MTEDMGKVYVTPETEVTSENLNDQVLLQKNSATTLSRIFTVSSKPVRLIAFGLVNDSVIVRRVWTAPTNGGWDSCGNYKGNPERLEQPYKIGCKTIELNSDVTELVIDAVGDFRLEYVGDNRPQVQVVNMSDEVATIDEYSRGGACFCECGGG